MRKIAIVEDDQATNDRLKKLVESLGDVEVEQAFDRESAEKLFGSRHFDLVIVDVELGQGPKDRYGGLTLLANLKGKRTVAIVVSGVSEENLSEVALSLHAYDFIGKPIVDLDFVNKVEHALEWQRESTVTREEGGTAGQRMPPGLEIDPARYVGLRWNEKPVRLTLTQLRLVHCLIEHPGRVVEHAKLQRLMDTSKSSGALATHISGVRDRFLDVDSAFDRIESEPGKGYAWKIDS